MFDLSKDPDEMNSMVDEEKYDQMMKSKNVPILIKKKLEFQNSMKLFH